jgi:hypothetical protein
LYERQIRLITGEAALRSPPVTEETMRGQLDRLITIGGLPTVEIAILPLGVMPALLLSGFALHDDLLVLVETLTGEQRLDEPDEVAVYVSVFETMFAAATTGPDAVRRYS